MATAALASMLASLMETGSGVMMAAESDDQVLSTVILPVTATEPPETMPAAKSPLATVVPELMPTLTALTVRFAIVTRATELARFVTVRSPPTVRCVPPAVAWLTASAVATATLALIVTMPAEAARMTACAMVSKLTVVDSLF